MPLLFAVGGRFVPSLDGAVMRLLGGNKPLTVVARERGLPGIDTRDLLSRITAGTLSVPVRSDGAMDIYYLRAERGAAACGHRLSPTARLAPGSLAQTIVYIAPPGADVATPMGPEGLGQVHAEAMENILLGTPLKSADGLYGGLVFVLIVGLGHCRSRGADRGFYGRDCSRPGAIAAAQAFTWYLFTDSRTLFDSLNPSLALAAGYGAAFVARSLEIARTRATLRACLCRCAAGRHARSDRAHDPHLLKIRWRDAQCHLPVLRRARLCPAGRILRRRSGRLHAPDGYRDGAAGRCRDRPWRDGRLRDGRRLSPPIGMRRSTTANMRSMPARPPTA